MVSYKYSLFIILALNLIVFAIYGVDKFLAVVHSRRVSEKWLFRLTLFCGGTGALLAMLLFNHKTRKPKFWGIAVIALVLQILIISMLIHR